ncbi:MAG: hypothetical protein FJ005_01425 [Chloroflexi bacterium]|nr:hypothetical protein [Chloroflexota bacterium]
MLKSEQVDKEIKLSGGSKERYPIDRIDILLAAMRIFSKEGRDEVSFSEFQESIAEFQREFPSLGYAFAERFLLSLDLLTDLSNLDYRGYIRDYHCRLDALLPKRFLSLTALGRGQGNKVLQTLTDDVVDSLTRAVKISIKNYNERWRLWAR